MPTHDKINPTSIKEAVRYDLGVLRQRAIDFLSDWIVIDGIIEKHPVQVKFINECWHVITRRTDSPVTFDAKKDAVDEAKRRAIDLAAALEIFGKSGLLEKRQNSILDIERPPLHQ